MADNIDDLFKKKYIQPAREKKLINAIIGKNSKAAKQELAENYLWLALQVAAKYKHPKINLGERTLEAATGLFKAVHEVAKKPKTMTFKDWAVSYMERAIRKAIDCWNDTIHISREEAEKLNNRMHKIKETRGEQAAEQFMDKELERLKKKYDQMQQEDFHGRNEHTNDGMF